MRAVAVVIAIMSVCGAAVAETVCRHVEVVEESSGLSLKGIEDLVSHPPSNSLILSVHDRWGDRDGDPSALMGLFGVKLSTLTGKQTVRARRLFGEKHRPMRPHGLAIRQRSDGDWRLLAIDHRHLQKEEVDGEPGTIIHDFSVSHDGALWPVRSVGHGDLCPANDLDWIDDDRALVTLDRTNCGGFWRFMELARAQHRGRVAIVDLSGNDEPIAVLQDLGFPNGVLVRDGDVFIAYSREDRIARYRWAAESLSQISSVPLDGGGDNLSETGNGELLLAVHPDIFDFGLYTMRVWGYETAPTRLVRLNREGGNPEVIYEATDGGVLSGVTGIVEAGGLLVGGAAFDEGLAVCERK